MTTIEHQNELLKEFAASFLDVATEHNRTNYEPWQFRLIWEIKELLDRDGA